jgi:molybdopterin-guanine dinucleotide biosynthesis protein A
MSDSIHVPGMIMVGSAGRNVGKTELACALIRRTAPTRDIIGLKITAVDKADGTCPRGGEGCGVCTSLTGPYSITEEAEESEGKDTTRLLQAGAKRVFWLRVLKSDLKEGWLALLDMVGNDAISVCESNTSRNIIQPGLFLMVHNPDKKDYKTSAAAVAHRVDRTLTFDGKTFTPDLENITIVDDSWILKEHASAIVLAGGNSSRMEQDKSMLSIEGLPLIEHVCNQLQPHFDAILVSTNEPDKHAFLGHGTVGDQQTGQGPMMGIKSALEASSHDLNFVVACDIPEVNTNLIHHLLDEADGYDAIVPRSSPDKIEPLFAVYRKSIIPHMEKALSESRRSVKAAFDSAAIKYVDIPSDINLHNLNTPDDYNEYTKE